ncbi:short-chain dehydrogenase [Micractinium conductrix]|uniref:Short-chain dehydrogenase n=1 Tax=Micractinium conductrix TaxID=554055 RepID=A0A2P6VA52_9CHLO|nr:short-chain dehydrogenase [Micractinium conductrix]|eukprot:PSC70969.1 short-chain dehydrogenase [Micractinium conductrix]
MASPIAIASIMKGQAALVTGAGSGIGRGLALELAGRGVAVTIADINPESAAQVAAEIEALGGQAASVACDVADSSQQLAAFRLHMQRFGRLDYALLNAGVGNTFDAIWGPMDSWQKTISINLTAVVEGVRMATRCMVAGSPDAEAPPPAGDGARSSTGSDSTAGGTGGVILVVSSLAGVYPLSTGPAYSSTKAAALQLVRCFAQPLMAQGVRIAALCPSMTLTPMVEKWQKDEPEVVAALMASAPGNRMLTVAEITKAGMTLLTDSSKVGSVLVVYQNGSWLEPRTEFSPVAMDGEARGGGTKAAALPTAQQQATHDSVPPTGCCLPFFRRCPRVANDPHSTRIG